MCGREITLRCVGSLKDEAFIAECARLPDPAPGLPGLSFPHPGEEYKIWVVKASLQGGEQPSVGDIFSGVPKERLFYVL